MSALLDTLRQQLSGDRISQISKQLGADESSTERAIAAAMPMLIGGLARNTTRSQAEAQDLAVTLERDHDGSLLDNLSGLLGGGSGGGGLGGLLGAAGSLLGGSSSRATDSDGILRHVLGDKRNAVEVGASRASGLDTGKVSGLLGLLAPIVMSALGRVKQEQHLDAGGLSALLDRERAELEEETSKTGVGGLLGLLDSNNDGQISDDIARLGSDVASGLLRKLTGR